MFSWLHLISIVNQIVIVVQIGFGNTASIIQLVTQTV